MHETVTVNINLPLEPPSSPPVLRSTNTDGYYCRKRAATTMLKELVESGLTLEQALQEKCRFFLERPGGTEQYNGIYYVSQECERCIEALLIAYKAQST